MTHTTMCNRLDNRLALTAVAVLGWIAMAANPAWSEQRFIENDDLNGQREVVDASHAWHVTDAGVQRLRSYTLRGEIDYYVQNKVRLLELDGTQITDAALAHLVGKDGLIALEELSLADTQISDRGLKSLAELKSLRCVRLGRTIVFTEGVSGAGATDAGVNQLQTILPDCRVTHDRVSIELSEAQRRQFRCWSEIAVPRLNERGDITALFIRRDAPLTPAHRESLPQLTQLVELYAADVFTDDDVLLLPALAGLRHLCLRGCLLNDGSLAPLEKLTDLQVLDLAHTQLTDEGLSHLLPLTHLTAIDIRGTNVRTRGLQSLRSSLPTTEFVFDPPRVVGLPYRWLTVNEQFELKDVGRIGYRATRPAIVQELRQLLEHPSLQQMSLRHSEHLRDDDLKIVAEMANLTELDLGNTKIGASGVQHLANLSRLKKLDLWHTKIRGDGGLSALEGLTELESLELDETAVDDQSLLVLARMKSLRYVKLWHTSVTRAGVARLQQSRPDMELKSNPRN